jgi:hypothetical protein
VGQDRADVTPLAGTAAEVSPDTAGLFAEDGDKPGRDVSRMPRRVQLSAADHTGKSESTAAPASAPDSTIPPTVLEPLHGSRRRSAGARGPFGA